MMITENIAQGRPKPYMSKEGISFGAYTIVYTIVYAPKLIPYLLNYFP